MSTDHSKPLISSPWQAIALALFGPVFIISLFAQQAFFFVLIFGGIIAGVLVYPVSGLLFYTLRKLKGLCFPWCLLVGTLCANTGSRLLHKSYLPLEFSLSTIISFSVLGAAGGGIFWFVHVRNNQYKTPPVTLALGYLLLVPTVCWLMYANNFKQIDYLDAHTADVELPVEADRKRQVPIEIEGEPAEANLSPTEPFRANCPITVSTWTELYTGKIRYSVSRYHDDYERTIERIQNPDKEQQVKKRCDG